MLPDYHIHTRLCGHACGEIAEYVEQAIRLGLPEIGFADHMPLEVWRAQDPELTMSLKDMETYQTWVAVVQERYRGQIRIKFGLEADFYPGTEEAVAAFMRRYDFDYVIGSIHWLGDWGFDDTRFLAQWGDRSVDVVYGEYFQTLQQSMHSGLFDIIGHADLVKKFGHRPSRDLSDWYGRLAEAGAAAGVVMELNTNGWHRPAGEAYPHPQMLRACREAGVPVVVTSDAHAPEQVARDQGQGACLAWEAGYRRVPLFTQRKISGWLEIEECA